MIDAASRLTLGTSMMAGSLSGDDATRVDRPAPPQQLTKREEYPMAQRRTDNDYYERMDRDEGFPLATTIRWVGIVTVTLIVAYIAVQVLSTLQAIF